MKTSSSLHPVRLAIRVKKTEGYSVGQMETPADVLRRLPTQMLRRFKKATGRA